jgi:hypothetical protein
VSRFFKGVTYAGSSSWNNNTVIHTNEDALYICVTRRAADTGDYADVGMRQVVLVDEHGCEFVPTRAGGEDDGRLVGRGSGGYSVEWFRFEAFPRHERNFRLRFCDFQPTNIPAGLTLHNPAPLPQIKHWKTESLPISKSNGDLTFILTSAKIRTNDLPQASWYASSRMTDFKYEVREVGQISSNWEALDTELYDSSGNFASSLPMGRILCPQESAWKLRVRFFGSEQSRSVSNVSWTLRGLAVPAPGEFVNLGQSNVLQGVEVKAMFFAGPGNFNYSNGDASRGSPLNVQSNENIVQSTWNSSRTYIQSQSGRNNYTYKVQGTVPHFYVEPPKPKPGTINYLQRMSYQTKEAFLGFDLAPDSKTVDVTFCVHGCCTPEFIFKPPNGQDAAVAEQSNNRRTGTNVSVRPAGTTGY